MPGATPQRVHKTSSSAGSGAWITSQQRTDPRDSTAEGPRRHAPTKEEATSRQRRDSQVPQREAPSAQ
eukprot:2167329-Amphidinium_carterae.2